MSVPAADNLRRVAADYDDRHCIHEPAMCNWCAARHAIVAAVDLLDALDAQVSELLADHQPEWANEEAKAAGKEPWVCGTCGVADGSWPCTSLLIAEDMHRLLHPEATDE